MGHFAKGVGGVAVAVVAGKHYFDDQFVRARLHRAADVEFKRRVAAFVLTHLRAVDPCGGVVTGRAKVENGNAAIQPGAYVKAAAIPYHTVVLTQIVKLRLPGQRHGGSAPCG